MIYFFQEILAQKDKTVNQQIIVAYLRKFLKTKLSGQMVCTSGQTIFLSGQSCLRLSKHLIYQAVYISVSALRFSVSTKLKQLVRSFTQSQSVPWPWKTCPKLLNHMSPDPSTPQNKSCKYLAQIFSFWDIAKIFSKWWSLTAVGFFVCFFFFNLFWFCGRTTHQLPNQRSNPRPLLWKHGVLTTGLCISLINTSALSKSCFWETIWGSKVAVANPWGNHSNEKRTLRPSTEADASHLQGKRIWLTSGFMTAAVAPGDIGAVLSNL